jgi:uncharacterized protein (TIGR03067 family)
LTFPQHFVIGVLAVNRLSLIIAISVICIIGSMLTVHADEKDAIKALNGEWSLTSMELGGSSLPPQSLTLINKDGEYTVKAESEDKGTVTVDATKSPKTMVIKGWEGPNKGKTFLCIYELSGDELKVCYDLSGKEHPKEFKSKAGTLHMLAKYKRVKK